MMQVALPHHLRTLIGVGERVEMEMTSRVTIGAVLDALEKEYPALIGTIRDHGRGPRRPFIRFFADGEDLSFCSWDHPIPESVQTGAEPFFIIGAIAGG